MPFKHDAAHRHHTGKMKFKVTNWPDYEAGLRRRGSLTLWLTPETLAMWVAPRRTTRGGQPRYSDLATETALTLGLVFGLRLHYKSPPVDGPLHVLIDSTGLQVHGAGQWLEEQHGARSRRRWRELHLALDADSGEIIAHTMTDQATGDASQVEPLFDQIDGPIGQFTADGAYDGKPTYDTVINHNADAAIVVLPHTKAVERADAEMPDQRSNHITAIETEGRMKWQGSSGYGKRALVETAIGRYRSIIGRRLRARSFRAQQDEVAIGCAVLNRMLACARPKSVHYKGEIV